MEPRKPRSWRERLTTIYWIVVGLVGLGRPIVDRRAMYGNDPTNDPYSIEYDRSSKEKR